MNTSVFHFSRILGAAALVALTCVLVTGDLYAEVPSFSFDDELEEHLVEVTSVFSISSARAGETYPAAVVIKVAPDWHINSASPYHDYLIPAELVIDSPPGIVLHRVSYPEGIDVSLGGQKMSVYDGEVVIHFQISIDGDLKAGEYTLPVSFTSQACNDRECRAPQTLEAPLTIWVGEQGEPINTGIFSVPDRTAESEPGLPTSVDTKSDLQLLIDEYGFWGYLLALGLAFVTGLLLSFSPCTYPMIPITVSIFAGQERSMGRGFVLSLIYVGTMAVMYGIMGLIVSLIGGVFGSWLASPSVVIGIAVVFVIFALSMFGLYELQVPSSIRQKLGTKASGNGITGSIILGIIAALVVSPCVGPFVAGILLYVATSGSPVIGFLVLFVFAMGLGTLYLIIGTFSSSINALPGSGAWMDSVKKFFGFVLLLMALYFLQTLVSPVIVAVLTGLLLVVLGVFGGGLDRLMPESGFFLRLKKLVGLLALLIGLYLLLGTVVKEGLILPPASRWLPVFGTENTEHSESLIDWKTDLDAALEQARSEGKPVLIDTWATWCVNCRVLDRKTFNHPDVAIEAGRFVPIKVQLETAGSPEAAKFMARFGLKHYSLPTTLLLDSTGQVRKIMKGVVGPDEMLAEMRRL